MYEGTAVALIDSVLDGFNSTLFAYGATGCGKTHTISGTKEDPGIIYRALRGLFTKIETLKESKHIECTISYLEIYNETIRDLLASSSATTSNGGLDLREDDSENRVVVAGLSEHRPQNAEEVMKLLDIGNSHRARAFTEANSVSSRSHAVLQVIVKQKDRTENIKTSYNVSTLSIIDLAGSERASATKNKGERLTEGANINRSLLALGNCINALCLNKANTHIPYRNSKLTRLLKHSLGGNCKVCMIANISPCAIHYEETHNTLKYANRAKDIKIKAEKNEVNLEWHVSQYPKIIESLRKEIAQLKGLLENERRGNVSAVNRAPTATTVAAPVSRPLNTAAATNTSSSSSMQLPDLSSFQSRMGIYPTIQDAIKTQDTTVMTELDTKLQVASQVLKVVRMIMDKSRRYKLLKTEINLRLSLLERKGLQQHQYVHGLKDNETYSSAVRSLRQRLVKAEIRLARYTQLLGGIERGEGVLGGVDLRKIDSDTRLLLVEECNILEMQHMEMVSVFTAKFWEGTFWKTLSSLSGFVHADLLAELGMAGLQNVKSALVEEDTVGDDDDDDNEEKEWGLHLPGQESKESKLNSRKRVREVDEDEEEKDGDDEVINSTSVQENLKPVVSSVGGAAAIHQQPHLQHRNMQQRESPSIGTPKKKLRTQYHSKHVNETTSTSTTPKAVVGIRKPATPLLNSAKKSSLPVASPKPGSKHSTKHLFANMKEKFVFEDLPPIPMNITLNEKEDDEEANEQGTVSTLVGPIRNSPLARKKRSVKRASLIPVLMKLTQLPKSNANENDGSLGLATPSVVSSAHSTAPNSAARQTRSVAKYSKAIEQEVVEGALGNRSKRSWRRGSALRDVPQPPTTRSRAYKQN